MEKVKKSNFMGNRDIFHYYLFCIMQNQIMLPAILILIVGIIILPPINEKIESKLADEEKVKNIKLLEI